MMMSSKMSNPVLDLSKVGGLTFFGFFNPQILIEPNPLRFIQKYSADPPLVSSQIEHVQTSNSQSKLK